MSIDWQHFFSFALRGKYAFKNGTLVFVSIGEKSPFLLPKGLFFVIVTNVYDDNFHWKIGRLSINGSS